MNMNRKTRIILDNFLQVIEDAKYLNRLNRDRFKRLLFEDCEDSYVDAKWELFQRNMMEFMWSCSKDKIANIAQFIDSQKYRDERPYLYVEHHRRLREMIE